MSERVVELLVCPRGTATCLYTEDVDLARLGEVRMRRAGHCEPDARGRWWADLSPVAGPRLGPFTRRSEALNAEVGWLRWNKLNAPPSALVARTSAGPIHKGASMLQAVLALVVLVIAYLVLCGTVSWDRGCAARASPASVPAKTSQEVKHEVRATAGAGGGGGDRLGDRGHQDRRPAR